ncbi:MAG TPA: AAA family ATPase [Dongiaceae bacterium]|jgi:flagellar biosynthesis protein FlhF|nr:AAA family ATPase [Dongiaceae bacterium]
MRLRTFTAANMSEAIRLVRDELGPDAVILNTEAAAGTVKITAALDRAAILEPPPMLAAEPMDAIAAALDFHGVPPLLADRLMTVAESFLLDNPRQALGAALRARFGFAPLQPKATERPVMLVGLPGAGKTATLAKLAAAARAAKRAVTAITCDVGKAGAIDQLAVYAKAIGVTAYQAKSPTALRRAVGAAPEGALVLIDTAGTNPLRAEDLAALADLAQAAKAEPVLVLSAGGDASESAEQGQLFSEIGCERMVAAKIDAARRFGGLLAAAENGKLSLAGSGISPEIANGFEFTGADGLARLLMPQDMARAPKAAQNSPRRGAQGRKTEAAKRKKEIGSGA